MKAVIPLLLLLSIGCSREWCITTYGEKVDTVRVVSVRDSLVYRDTTIVVKIPGDTVYNEVTIPCPPPPASYVPDTARAETTYAIARAWWSYPVVALELVQKETDIQVRLDSVIKESYHWRMEFERVTALIPKKYVPKIYKQAMSIVVFMFIGFVAWIFFKIKKIV